MMPLEETRELLAGVEKMEMIPLRDGSLMPYTRFASAAARKNIRIAAPRLLASLADRVEELS